MHNRLPNTWPILCFRSLTRLFLKLFNDEVVTVSSSKLFHKFIIRSEKKCWRSSAWKLFQIYWMSSGASVKLMSSWKKESYCTQTIILYTSIKSAQLFVLLASRNLVLLIFDHKVVASVQIPFVYVCDGFFLVALCPSCSEVATQQCKLPVEVEQRLLASNYLLSVCLSVRLSATLCTVAIKG